MPKRKPVLNKLLAVRIARKYQDFKGTKEQLIEVLKQDKELVGIDPAQIMALIQLIQMVIELIQKWREKKKPVNAILLDDDEILSKLK
jgi:hypothetical protein